MLALLALSLAAARPLPNAADLADGQRATQCVLLYRLGTPDVPTDSAGCEDAGYGLEFMRERDPEIRALETRHADELAHAKDKGRARAAAKAQRSALEVPCTELALGTGPGPDGGAELCALAGWSPSLVAAKLSRERSAEGAESDGRPSWVAMGSGLVIVAVVLLAVLGLRRGGKS